MSPAPGDARLAALIAELLASHGPDDPARFLALADRLLEREDLPAAASALDRAYGLAPADPAIARQRAAILDALALHEHGLAWRYVPAGTFLMGSRDGDPDERPVHPRRLAAFWICDAPIAWAAYAALRGWPAPPGAYPPRRDGEDGGEETFAIVQRNKIRRQYELASGHDRLPMIAAATDEAEALSAILSTPTTYYGLPTEAQWEKAARGGLVGRRYAWGDEPPTPARCDFDHMGEFRIADPRAFPPNGYGLYGVCGGVWEWTADPYDALAYRGGAPAGDGARDAPNVLRGGSWADCAAAITVSFRMAPPRLRLGSPNVGMRLVRVARAPRGSGS